MISNRAHPLAPGESPGAKVTIFAIALALAALAASAAAAEQVTVTLVGGAKISATLLRENEEGIVLDLGTEVLNIPTKRVLDIDRHAKASKQESKSDRGIFATGRLE